MKRAAILGVNLTSQHYDAAIARLLAMAEARESRRAHFCTVHSVVEATRNVELRAIYDSADLACMDGMPLVWVARLRGFDAERVCGPDVMLSICDRGRELGLRHYFVGGGEGTAAALCASLTGRFPGLDVVGLSTPPFRPMTIDEDDELVRAINQARPNVVWVGLGAPKQDIWAASHVGQIDALILAVGAAFDFHSGRLRRAPKWMRKAGLEWLFRLAMEPRRLMGRYVRTNLLFVSLLVKEEAMRRLRS